MLRRFLWVGVCNILFLNVFDPKNCPQKVNEVKQVKQMNKVYQVYLKFCPHTLLERLETLTIQQYLPFYDAIC